MKYHLIVLFCFLRVLILHSQSSINSELNMFRANDTIVKQQIEYKNPGRSGANVLWDFSKQSLIDKKYTLIYALKKNTGSIITGKEHRTRYYYSLQNDSLLLWGFENPTTKINHSQPELLLRFPTNYGDKTHSYYQGTGKYCGRLNIAIMGKNTSEADAYGMIILPGKDTIKHVLRIKTVKLINETLSPIKNTYEETTGLIKRAIPSDSIEYALLQNKQTIMTETYKWYAAGYRYPVFETIRTGNLSDSLKAEFFSTAFYYPPGMHQYLKTDTANTELQKKIQKNTFKQVNNDDNHDNPAKSPLDFSYNIYPNPVQTELTFEYYISDYANISYGMYDMSGRQLFLIPTKKYSAGVYRYYINMNDYLRGEYLIQIHINTTVFSEKIIKR